MKTTPTLSDRVMKSLESSSEKRPVSITLLRALCTDDPDQLDELYRLLDELNLDHIVQRRAGMKEGKQQLNYWLTQPLQTSAAAPKPQKPAAVVHQEKPASPPPAKPTVDKKTIKQRSAPMRGLGKRISELVIEHPGIDLEILHLKLTKDYPDIDFTHVKNMVWYCANYKTIRTVKINTDDGGYKLYPVAQPAAEKQQVSKTRSPTASTLTTTASKFDCAMRMDCGMTIIHGVNRIELDPDTALHLMKFCSHQLIYAEENSAA